MAYEPDIAAVDPVLELTLDDPKKTLRCTGTVDRRTLGYVVTAVDGLLAGAPSTITIDVAHLTIADVDGANALAHIQRRVREAGVRLRWQGLDSDQLRGILPLRYRARRPRRPSPAWDTLHPVRPRHFDAAAARVPSGIDHGERLRPRSPTTP